MVTLIDVLHKICPDAFRGSNDLHCDLNVCITGDVEASESEFMTRYGAGTTHYFRLENYHHGHKLAAALYKRLKGHIFDLPDQLMYKYSYDSNMYFFVHVKDNEAIAAY